ncbi:metallophosphoesterase [Clostridium felsineum]|uniref:metallophosphoesterase n=1 Tax=Clostridium felsineum TaxID=36839 RepID=UPI00098BEA15|nr:metallophosphoesterase [Clostridium felsineum]URZ04085.1 Putative metallophosphoesterase MG207 [Clostridium felsineum]
MRIAVMSDTHMSNEHIKRACDSLKMSHADIVIHLGDNVQDIEEIKKYYKGEIIYIKGNCDYTNVPAEKTFSLEKKRFFITHGDRYAVKYNTMKLEYRVKELEADIVLFGHTHISKIDFNDGIWYINPGSVSYPRNGCNSLAYIDIVDGKIHAKIKKI